jgi:DivIVA domain-containing protein
VAEPRATKESDGTAAAARAAQAQPEALEKQADVPAAIRNASFPAAMRGYDRGAVDAYVRRVNRVIAELEVTRSPQAAVRHAVERVSQQTKAVLDEARESAEQITSSAREEADGMLATAKAEAAELVVGAGDEAQRVQIEAEQLTARTKAEAEEILARANAEAEERRKQAEDELTALREEAEARMRELANDTDAVRRERKALLEDIDRMAEQLHDAASAAAARFALEPEQEPDTWPGDVDQTAVIAPGAAAETVAAETPSKNTAPGNETG